MAARWHFRISIGNEVDQKVYLAIYIPLLDGEVATGMLAFRLNPDSMLYRWIERWPSGREYGETLLVRREGEEAVILNALPSEPDAALNIRVPVTKVNTVVVQAVSGKTGFVMGKDHRGAQVIACIQPMPGTPWTLITSMPLSKVQGGQPVFTWELSVLLAAIHLSFAAVVLVLWRWQRENYFRKLIETEAALHEADDQYRMVLDSVPDVAIQGYEADGTIIYWNAASEVLFGYRASETIGRNLSQLDFPEAVIRPASTGIRKMAEQGRPFRSGDLELRHRNGTPLSVYSGYAVVRFPGRPCRVFCMNIDLTVRMQAEETLRIQGAALEAAANAIVITDRDGVVEWVNPAFTACTGYAPEDALGKNPRDLVYSGSSPKKFLSSMWKPRPARGEALAAMTQSSHTATYFTWKNRRLRP